MTKLKKFKGETATDEKQTDINNNDSSWVTGHSSGSVIKYYLIVIWNSKKKLIVLNIICNVCILLWLMY